METSIDVFYAGKELRLLESFAPRHPLMTACFNMDMRDLFHGKKE
jgi:hypothetical protein